MRIASFLKLVEIQTKVASILPFFLGTAYGWYRFGRLDPKNFVLMFFSLVVFDMATTAINNYYDYKRAQKKHGYGYEKHNAIVRDQISEASVKRVIFVLLALSIAAGLWLYLKTSLVVLVLGVCSFLIGILYSFGPVPLCRTPSGELFSGFFMGFIIPLLAIYIHNVNLITLSYQQGSLQGYLALAEVGRIFMISLPAFIGIANIMLANNICDMVDDLENKRYTLPQYIGKKDSLTLYKVLYHLAYIDIALIVILQILPWYSAIALLTIPVIYKNISLFKARPSKQETFVLAVKNFVLLNSAHLVGILLAIATKLLI